MDAMQYCVARAFAQRREEAEKGRLEDSDAKSLLLLKEAVLPYDAQEKSGKPAIPRYELYAERRRGWKAARRRLNATR